MKEQINIVLMRHRVIYLFAGSWYRNLQGGLLFTANTKNWQSY